MKIRKLKHVHHEKHRIFICHEYLVDESRNEIAIPYGTFFSIVEMFPMRHRLYREYLDWKVVMKVMKFSVTMRRPRGDFGWTDYEDDYVEAAKDWCRANTSKYWMSPFQSLRNWFFQDEQDMILFILMFGEYKAKT